MDIPLREWLKNYDAGKYDSNERSVQCDAGWYDWFCNDETLGGRLKVLAPKLKNIAKSSKINLDTMYVFFKNNCPLDGELYDDFRICDADEGNVVFTIVPFTGYRTFYGVAEVWGTDEKDGEFKRLVTGKMEDVYKFFGVEEEFESIDFYPDTEVVPDDEDDW